METFKLALFFLLVIAIMLLVLSIPVLLLLWHLRYERLRKQNEAIYARNIAKIEAGIYTGLEDYVS